MASPSVESVQPDKGASNLTKSSAAKTPANGPSYAKVLLSMNNNNRNSTGAANSGSVQAKVPSGNGTVPQQEKNEILKQSNEKKDPVMNETAPPASVDAEEEDNENFETVVSKKHGHASVNSKKFRGDNSRLHDRDHPRHRRHRGHDRIGGDGRGAEKSTAPNLQKVVTNGSICSETSSSSSNDCHIVSITPEENGTTSNSTESAGENDGCESTNANKPKFVAAPPPSVNPWVANRNAASVIAKKPSTTNGEATVVTAPIPAKIENASLQRELPVSKSKPRKIAPPAPVKVEKVPSSGTQDWPALDEVPTTPSATSKSSLDVKLVRFASSATESTDSDGEDSLPPNQLSPDKWPSISDAGDISKAADNDGDDAATVVVRIEVDPNSEANIRATNGDISNEEGLADSEHASEEQRIRKTKKSARPKWVPLSLPESSSQKTRSPRKDKVQERSPKTKNNGNRVDGDSDFAENDAPTTFRAPSRGRRGGAVAFRGGRGGMQNGRRFPSFQKDLHDHRPAVHQDSYTDYPADFTTLSALYPASEFIMPYVTHAFGPPAYVASSLAGPALVSPDAGTPYVLSEENTVLVEMVEKQIEYYFSDENLEKDFYLRRKMDADGYLPVRLISSFHRVKSMTQDYGLVLTAIRKSSELELREDMSCVRTVKNPTKWPILDTVVPPPPVAPHPPMMMPLSSGIGIPLPTGKPHSLSEGGEMLNPNLPEFVPKSAAPASNDEIKSDERTLDDNRDAISPEPLRSDDVSGREVESSTVTGKFLDAGEILSL